MGFVISNGRGVESLSYYSKVSCGMTLAKSEYLVLNAYSNFHLFYQFFEHSNKVRCNKKSFSAKYFWSPEDDDESDKRLEAQDRRYLCLKSTLTQHHH